MHPMLNIAVKAARRAGAIINRASQDIGTLTVKSKNFNDFVSEVDVAAEQRCHGDVGAHDDDLHFRAMLQIKAAILGDERHEKRHGAGGDGDANFFRAGFFLGP
mgnify:CR=1 FL=1